MTLPPFSTDEAVLELLEAAMYPREHGDPDAQTSSLQVTLDFFSAMAGTDLAAVEEDHDVAQVMRDPHYNVHDVIMALIQEVRRLRAV